ncbi:hypothetical protein K491DRAFT_721961 [Lophiostoma macrostomum CBS 122681]|uniref:Uncharacterized protein n=1 Tax=Lophiostoma macrostomum CBS 122681 TaxID=1314788 RepID=A0A6A6SR99_9PLEO|nr:hypothetical protein K491DRAFT_721961 [Lophiostoma macrostomum CBS 122681]
METVNKSLLHQIVDVIESEKPDLLFDYFAIHSQCCDVLDNIREESDKITNGHSKTYMSRGDHLNYVVGFIFALAAGQFSIGNAPERESSNVLLDNAAETMKTWIEKGHRDVETRFNLLRG